MEENRFETLVDLEEDLKTKRCCWKLKLLRLKIGLPIWMGIILTILNQPKWKKMLIIRSATQKIMNVRGWLFCQKLAVMKSNSKEKKSSKMKAGIATKILAETKTERL